MPVGIDRVISLGFVRNLLMIATRKFCTEVEARHLFKQATSAVAYLHSLKIAHRDVKLDNFLIIEPITMLTQLTKVTVKLADFEFSARYTDNSFFSIQLYYCAHG